MPRLYIPENFRCDLPPLPLEVKRFPIMGDIPVDEEAVGMALRLLPAERITYIASRLPNLRWLQLLVAGVDQALKADLPERVTICKGVGIHEAPTAEMAVTLLLSGLRGMQRWRDNQKKHFWDERAYSEQLNSRNRPLGTLEGAQVLILGMGTIGLEIARRLVPFGAKVEGVAQSAGTRDGFKTHASEDLFELLPKADAVIAVLPETTETRAMLSQNFFNRMQKHAWFVNVGRGTAVDEAALAEALGSKKIAGAALDVTAEEPLPADSPLWDFENLIIAPHVGGGGPLFYQKACALIAENAGRFTRGEPLLHVVDRKRGY